MKRLSLGAIWLETTPFIKREAGLLLPVALLFLAIPVALIFYAIPPELRHMQLDPTAPRPAIPAGAFFAILLCLLAVMSGTLSLYALALKPGISGVIEALRVGWELTKGQFLRLILFLVVVTLAIMLVQFLGEIMLGLVGFAIGGKDMALQMGNLGAAIALGLGQVYLIVMIARIYRQLES